MGVDVNEDDLVVDVSQWFDHSRENFNQLKFYNYLKGLEIENYKRARLVFDGIEQLTDEVFYVLSECKACEHLRVILTSVSAVGCVHLTDYSMKMLGNACPNLVEVDLDGCSQLTDKTISYFILYCSLTSLSMRGTSVSYLPRLTDTSMKLHVEGCSIFDPPNWHESQKDADRQAMFCCKLVVMSQTVQYSFIDSIKSGKFVLKSEAASQKPLVFDDKFVSIGETGQEDKLNINIFEIQDKMVHLAPFMTNETSYVIMVTMESIRDQSAQLNILQYINSIKAVTEQGPILILVAHGSDISPEELENIAEMCQGLDYCIQAQMDNLGRHLQMEKYNSKYAKRKDFQSQKLYIRSLMQYKRSDVYCFLRFNVDTLESQQYNLQESSSFNKADAQALHEKWYQEKGSVAYEMIDSINKSEISELKSFAKPPKPIQACMACLLVVLNVVPTKYDERILEFVENSWTSTKKTLSDSNFLSKIRSYDVQTGMTEKQIEQLDTIFNAYPAELTDTKQSQVSSFGRKIFRWVDSMYSYTKAVQEQTSKTKSYPVQKGMDALFRQINGMCRSVVGLNFQQGHMYSKTFQKFYDEFPRTKKMYSLQDFVDSLPEKFYGSDTVLYEKALKRLHLMGRCLFYPQVAGKPIIADVQWFMDLLCSFDSLPVEFQNGRRLKTLVKSCSLLTVETIGQFWKKDVSTEQLPLVLDVLRHFGVLLDVPYVRTTLTCPPYYLVPAKQISEKPFFHSIKEGVSHTLTMMKNWYDDSRKYLFQRSYWPKFQESDTRDTDIELSYDFKFSLGYPASFTTQVLREVVKLGGVTLLWGKGCLIEKGAVEILIKNNMHAVLFSERIEVSARVTKAAPEQILITHEYAWSILHPYLLLIEYMVDQYPVLHSKHRVPCLGVCSETIAHTFSPVEFLPGESLMCPTCDKPVPELDQKLMTGRKRVPHIHMWITTDQQVTCTLCENCVTDLHDQCPYNHLNDPSQCGCVIHGWYCRHCGICRRCAGDMWKMDKALYPSFTASSFKVISPPNQHLSGNIIKHPLGGVESDDNSPSYTILKCQNAFAMTSHRTLQLTILDDGPVTVVIDKLHSSDEVQNKVPLDHLLGSEVVFRFETNTGKLLSNGEETSLGNQAVFNANDTLAIEVIKDFEKNTNGRLTFHRTLEVRKNHKLLTTVDIAQGCGATILLGSDGEKNARVAIYSPTVMNMTSSYFDVGSAMIFHTDVGNTWKIGQISSITSDGDLVLTDGGDNQYTFQVNSEKILPVCFSHDLHLMVNGELCMGEDQLTKYLVDRSCTTPQWSMFTYYTGQQFKTYQPIKSLFCSESIYSYRVLLSTLKFKGTRDKGFRPRFGVALLPSGNLSNQVFVPSRQAVQNWAEQSYVVLCPGNLLSHSKDSHFMLDNRQPMPNFGEVLQHQGALEFLIFSLAILLQNKLVLPKDYEKMFPDAQGSKEEAASGIAQMLKMSLHAILLKLVYLSPQFLQDWNPNLHKGRKMIENHLKLSNDMREPPCSIHNSVWYMGKMALKKGKNKEEKTQNFDIDSNSPYTPCIKAVKLPPNSTCQFALKFVANFPNLLHLNITKCEIKSDLGQIIKLCPQLEILELEDNGITELPIELTSLSETLVNMTIKEPEHHGKLPEWLGQFRRLRYLILDDSCVTDLPDNIGQLPLLTLSLRHCPIRQLPSSFANLKRLSLLKIHGIPWPIMQKDKKFFSISEWKAFYNNYGYYKSQEDVLNWFEPFECDSGKMDTVGYEKFINFLLWHVPRLGVNPVTKICSGIPPEIFMCQSLKHLELPYQAFTEVPACISKLRRLDMISVAHCKRLEQINEQIGTLNLRVLALADTPNLHTPPQEVVSKGMGQTIVYLKRLGEGSQICKRTKLMFVGLGGAGKTSLMRALMSSEFKAPISQTEAITDGIDISTWTISRNNQSLTYSVWDFAGQTLYYNTHQFFLSSRSVYLLMWNTRLGFEHAGLNFWLSSIKCHAPEAPIFVIGTHADKVSKSELPTEKLIEKYPSIAGFHLVSSLTGQGVEALLDSISKATLEQPYINERIPDAWLKFESSIFGRRSTDSVLDWSTIQNLATKCGLSDDETKQAVQFLHELGSLQHFQNEVLRNKVVINPQWIVDVMSCVVSVHNDVIKDGVLKHADIGKIWKNYASPLHKWLLHLTEVFDLTFPLTDQPANIVPCLLPQTQPNFDWPDIRGQNNMRETKMEYIFDYLPAGLFNRIQVRLSEFSERATMWKTGSLLTKNSHLALIMQRGETDVLVKVQGPRPENILLLIHEVFEGLVAESFQGVTYEYQIPCSDCMEANLREPTMFSSGILHSALELKAMFLQCHKRFHTLSISHIQTTMPPDSTTDFDLHFQNMVQDLSSLQDRFTSDVFFLYCEANTPKDESECKLWVHPRIVQRDLEAAGFVTTYMEGLAKESLEDVAVSMAESKIVLVFISNEFVEDENCQRMFKHVKENLKKPIFLLVVGQGYEWQKSDIGMQLAEKVYFCLDRPSQYEVNRKGLISRLALKTGKKNNEAISSETDVFISYAWSNSESAIECGEAAARPGSVGFGDPRKMKEYLESNGLSCWLDIDRVGESGLFEDIAEGLKRSKVMVACISDEYTLSQNCQMEFRFAHVTLKIPIIVCVVGTGLNWESTEIGMLSLAHPRINFQINNNTSIDKLLSNVREKLSQVAEKATAQRRVLVHRDTKTEMAQKKQNAFQELFELAQRKFLRQITNHSDKNVLFPRMFIIDTVNKEEESEKEEVAEDEISFGMQDFFDNDELSFEFCFKILCEHDGGWHCTPYMIPIRAFGEELKSLWIQLAPYLGRILTILKHSDINLNILHTEEGKELVSFLEQNAGGQSSQIRKIYFELRKYIIVNSDDNCGLKRCLLASGRILWLCPEHQTLPRVSVLDSKTSPLVDHTLEYTESQFMSRLQEIAKDRSSPETGNDEDGQSDDEEDPMSEIPIKEEEPPIKPEVDEVDGPKENSAEKIKRLKYTIPVINHLSKGGKSKACIVM